MGLKHASLRLKLQSRMVRLQFKTFKNIVNEPVGPPAGIPPQNVVPIMFYGNLQYPTTYYLFNLLDDLKEEYGDKIRVEYRPVYGRLLADGEYVNDELVH